jgi:hypothetical protein
MTKELLNLFEATEEDVDHPTLEELVDIYLPPIQLKDEDLMELDPWEEDTITDGVPLTDTEDEVTDPFIPIVLDAIFELNEQLSKAKWLSQGDF